LKSLFFCLSFLPSLAFAADMNCGGDVTVVMGDHPSCQGHMAFKTKSSGAKWMCTKSKEAGSIVLTALTAKKNTGVFINNTDANSCSELPQYRTISYVMIYP